MAALCHIAIKSFACEFHPLFARKFQSVQYLFYLCDFYNCNMADSGEKPPQFLPQHTYDGIIYDFIFPASVLDEIKKFEYRSTDVICAGYPKTGE